MISTKKFLPRNYYQEIPTNLFYQVIITKKSLPRNVYQVIIMKKFLLSKAQLGLLISTKKFLPINSYQVIITKNSLTRNIPTN